MVRCKQCMRFFSACRLVFKHREELRVIYDANFKEDSMRRRAFIVRSHGVQDSSLRHWLITELQDLKRKRHIDLADYFGSQKRMEDPLKVVKMKHNDTDADINAVATITQEHPQCHLVKYGILRCTISPPCIPLTGEV